MKPSVTSLNLLQVFISIRFLTRILTRLVPRHWSSALTPSLLVFAGTVFMGNVFAGNTFAERLAPPLQEQAQRPRADSGAEVLYAIEKNRLDKNGHWQRERYYSIRILDIEAARDYGRLSFSYNHFYNDAELLFANVLNKKGEVKPVAEDAIQLRVVGGGQDFYSDRSEMVFSLPEVAPGSIIEFQYRVLTKTLAIDTVFYDGAGPHWVQPTVANDGWRADPVHYFEYELASPNNIELKNTVYGSFKAKPRTRKTQTHTVKTWRWQNIPGVALENAMPSYYEMFPQVRSSSSSDWSLVDAWSWAKIEDKLQNSQQLQSIINQMALAPDASALDKVKAVYAYLQNNIRYVFAHLGRGGYDPHHPDEVVKQGYGDCKDQSVLALSLLRALGVEAYPALIQTSGSGKDHMQQVALIFDHMIVWLPKQQGLDETWLDTTADRALFPGASPYLDGQPALVVNGKGGIVKQASVASAGDFGKLKLSFQSDAEQRSTVDLVATFGGVFEENFRSWWKHDSKRETSLKKMMGSIFEDSGQYRLNAQAINAENLFEPFEIHARFEFDASDNTKQPLAQGVSFFQLYSFFGGHGTLQIPESRKNRYVDDLSYTLMMEAEFSAPEGHALAIMNSSEGRSNPYFELSQSSRQQDKNYFVDIQYTRKSLELSSKQYAAFYGTLNKLNELGSWIVNVHSDEKAQSQLALASLEQEKGNHSFEYQLQLAKKLIDQGEFEKALAPAKRAVEIRKTNGEAWYLLGVAQGFTVDIEASNRSFEQAKRLGYVP